MTNYNNVSRIIYLAYVNFPIMLLEKIVANSVSEETFQSWGHALTMITFE